MVSSAWTIHGNRCLVLFLLTASLQSVGYSAGSRPVSSIHLQAKTRFSVQGGSVSQPFWGLDFSPYEAGQDPNVNPQVSASQIQSRLEIIAPYTSWVRSFSITTGLENIPPIAKGLRLKVAAGAWISKNLTQNADEVTNLIAAANAGDVDIAIVGSEVLLRGDVSEAQLIAYMNQVRAAIPGGIPVTTADTYGILLAHPNVIAASDVIAANFYSYWETDAIDNALCDMISEYAQVVNAAGGKQVIVSETGWPSGGVAQGAQCPRQLTRRSLHCSLRLGLVPPMCRSFILTLSTRPGKRITRVRKERIGVSGIRAAR